MVKAQQELEPETRGRKIDWQISKLSPLYGDSNLLLQVMINLLSNAIKFTRSRTEARIEISCVKDGKETIVCVRDNGVGFDEEYKDKLFGVFQRLHSEEEFEGTGIGLAMVQRVINKHDGRVWAESKLGKGATFYFALPGHNRLSV